MNIRYTRLRWLGHVERKTVDDVVMKTWNIEVCGHRNIGRPKQRWSDVIRNHMEEKGVQREEAHDRITWRLETRCVDPKIKKIPNKKKMARSALI